MPALSFKRSLKLVVASAVAGGLVLGLLPPVLGRRVPPTVVRARPVDIASLVPASATATDASGAVAVDEAMWTRPVTLCPSIRFTTVALAWIQRGTGDLTARLAWGEPGDIGPVRTVHADPAEAPDPGSPDDSGVAGTPPLWTDGAECLRFRLHLTPGPRIGGLRAAFINTSGTAKDPSPLQAAGTAVLGAWERAWGLDPAMARAPWPGFVRRSEWGANESLRNCRPDYADRVKMAFVHHTAGSNDYSRSEADDVVRGIYAYHTNVRGFCDIAYSFLVDRFGRPYEGRWGGMKEPVIPASQMGFNTGSTSVSAMGNFVDRRPSRAMLRAIKRLLAWRLDVAHLPPKGHATMTSAGGSATQYDKGEKVRLDLISGHRDTGLTSCPGRRLYAKLDEIRRGANRIGLPKIWRPSRSSAQIEAGQEEVRLQATLSWTINWTVNIRDADTGVLVRRFSGRSDRTGVRWDGTDELGLPVEDGWYRARFNAVRDDGLVARPAKRWVEVVSLA